MLKISTMLLGTWDVYQDGDAYYLYSGPQPILRYQKGTIVHLLKAPSAIVREAQVKYLINTVKEREAKITVREVINILTNVQDLDKPVEELYGTYEELLKVCLHMREVHTPMLGGP